jgi:L-phenylalanine/L-methionine N-acetyltransferase
MHRLATEADFKAIYDLYMHPTVNPYLLYELMIEEDFKPIYQDLINRKVKYVFEYEGKNAGMFKLVPNTYRAEHIVYLGGLAINPEYSGKGLGQKMFEAIIEEAKKTNKKRIELSVATFNDKAINLYKKVGFEAEGVLKKYTYLKSENRYIDELMMALLL